MSKAKFNPIISVEDDGLILPKIGAWADEKYKLLGGYCEIFTTGMKNKWDKLIYVDLFAGAGYAKISDTNKIRMTSSLIAMSVTNKFDKYILCEQDENCFNALKHRVNKHFPHVNVEFILGDSNQNVQKVIDAIPKHNMNESVLRFCFVDPFSLNLNFSTIRELASVGKIDFLILLALYMDANRNLFNYISENSSKVDAFIGDSTWREPFKNGLIPTQDFIKYLSEKYDANMRALEYVEPVEKQLVKNEQINVPLYYLAFYSKNLRGNDFFKKVEKYRSSQQSLF